ncbi:DUF4238 domain-containing protein [uncultured Mameliella sp.]|uniref:DUF4238 domain-containing protein n=1 Tax=uncultured Mameliella sp. TaxID=1447087 RepID=UPI00260BBE32|nr:DUF4238 domain-containing protein [uncultured Mameliella sp.]
MSKPNPPNKHHYLPEFYLKKWAGKDGRLCQFSRPYGNTVKPRRVFPSQTAYVERLYELRGLPEHLRQTLEQDFFKALDNDAAVALDQLLEFEGRVCLSNRHRSAWTFFLISLLQRSPRDVANAREMWEIALKVPVPELEDQYRKERNQTDPESIVELMATADIRYREQGFAIFFSGGIAGELTTKLILDLDWYVLDMASSGIQLMTSDKSVLFLGPIGKPKGKVIFPLSPSRLFIEKPRSEYADLRIKRSLSQLAKWINRKVTQHCSDYCYATSDTNLLFVQKHFGQTQQLRLTDEVLRHMREEFADHL